LDGDFDAAEALPAIVHTFSHYRLHLQPMRLRKVAPRARVGDNEAQRWVARAELAGLGLPAPIRKLLDSLRSDQRPCPARSSASTNNARPRAWISSPGLASWASASTPTSARTPGTPGRPARPS